MSNDFDEMFSVWPFRYYVIEWSSELSQYIFTHIPNPSDSEFDLTKSILIFLFGNYIKIIPNSYDGFY